MLDLFVASGRQDQIKAAIERRFASTSDTIYAGADSDQAADLPPDLLQDLAAIKTPFQEFAPDSPANRVAGGKS